MKILFEGFIMIFIGILIAFMSTKLIEPLFTLTKLLGQVAVIIGILHLVGFNRRERK